MDAKKSIISDLAVVGSFLDVLAPAVLVEGVSFEVPAGRDIRIGNER